MSKRKSPWLRRQRQKARAKPRAGYDMDRLEHVEGGKRPREIGDALYNVPVSVDPQETTRAKFGPKHDTANRRTAVGTDVNDLMADIAKKSPAMALTGPMIASWFNKKEEEPSLADQFIASTHDEGKHLHGRVRKDFQNIMMQYRHDMRVAHRFVLDDEFVRYATQAAITSPQRILHRLQYSNLPYDQTWIEFNLHEKVRVLYEMGAIVTPPNPSEVAERQGCLLQRINTDTAVCTLVSRSVMEQDGKIMPFTSCYFWSTVETNFFENYHKTRPFGCRPLTDMASKVPFVEGDLKGDFMSPEQMEVPKASMWGFVDDDGKKVGRQNVFDFRKGMHVPIALSHHGDIGWSRMFLHHKDVYGRSLAVEAAVSELKEFTGHMRWLVTVLAMLNEVPTSTQRVTRDRSMRVGLTKQHKLLDYHKVTLRLPKKHPVKYVDRKLDHIERRRNRAHDVRSHWRTYLTENYCNYEHHDWIYDHEHGYRLCSRCESEGRLIPQHVRGDPSLGWVRKDYVIKKDPRA